MINITPEIQLFLQQWGELMVATLALLLSVFSLGWQFCRDFVDRGRLCFQIDFAPITNIVTKEISQNHIIIRIINKGRFYVYVKSIMGINYKGEKDNLEISIIKSWNRCIEGLKMEVLIIPLENWIFSPYKEIVFITTDDKRFKITQKQLNALEKSILQQNPKWEKQKKELLSLANQK